MKTISGKQQDSNSIVMCILSEGDTCVNSCPRLEKCYPKKDNS